MVNAIKLTPLMLEALEAASRQPLRRVHDDREGKPQWPAAPATLRALERHMLLVVSERLSRQGWRIEEWSVSELGSRVLNPPPVLLVEQPQFLDRRGYTSQPSRAVDYELMTMLDEDGIPRVRRVAVEAVDAPQHLMEAGRVRHREAVERRVLARQLARNGRRVA